MSSPRLAPLSRTLTLIGLALALTCLSAHAQPRQASLAQWQMPWEPTDQRRLVVHGDAQDEDGFTAHILRVTDAAGKTLLTFDGQGRLLDMTALEFHVEPLETLLVTHWTAGLSTTRVIVFRATASAVVSVADLIIASDDIQFFDLDGDGFREMVVGERRRLQGRPQHEWPIDWILYRWNGSTLVRAGRLPAPRLTSTLRQALRLHPRGK